MAQNCFIATNNLNEAKKLNIFLTFFIKKANEIKALENGIWS